MTPPNKLEELAEFQDAIQSNEGLERLRAMQYLQQMNNQGLMGMPQVTEQPIIQRGNGGTTALSAFAGLGHTVDNIREDLTTEDLFENNSGKSKFEQLLSSEEEFEKFINKPKIVENIKEKISNCFLGNQ